MDSLQAISVSAEGTEDLASKPNGGSRLQNRLALRYYNTLQAFDDTIRKYSEDVDAEQTKRAEELKVFLAHSHAKTTELLQMEKYKSEQHLQILRAYERNYGEAPQGTVVPALIDDFHGEDEQNFTYSIARMKSERLRLLQVAVSLRQGYAERVEAIESCVRMLESSENARKKKIEESLRELILSLTKISYKSITASHILAQRVIHSVNQSFASNYMESRRMWSSLKLREIFKQRIYTADLAQLYSSTLERMATSSITWGASVLKSAVFRRPQLRAKLIESIKECSNTTCREGCHFIKSLCAMAKTLRMARDSEESECKQTFGGTTPDGWLRQFDGALYHDVFPTSPMEVVYEWRMRAIVVARNSLAACESLTQESFRDEEQLEGSAHGILAELLSTIEWIFTPLEETSSTLLAGSLSQTILDEVYKPFTQKNTQNINLFQGKAVTGINPIIQKIQGECLWFRKTIERGLRGCHNRFEEVLLHLPESVLHQFESATKLIEETATRIIGYVRSFYRERFEFRKDYEDHLAWKEADFITLSSKLLHAGTPEVAEEMFAEGLALLESIAATHTDFHKATVQALVKFQSKTPDHIVEQRNDMLSKLGLEDVQVTQEKFERLVREAMEEAARDQEAVAQSGKGGGAKKNVLRQKKVQDLEESSNDSTLLPPMEPVTYPQLCAASGKAFNIIGPMILTHSPPKVPEVVPVPVASPPPSAKASTKKQGKRGNSAKKMEPAPIIPPNPEEVLLATVEPSFVGHYEPLLGDNVGNPNAFVSDKHVEENTQTLRIELLNWVLNTETLSIGNAADYCDTNKSSLDEEINQLMRHERRRPAAFQADIYEARVRELENNSNIAEKYCARLRDRVLKVEEIWINFQANLTWTPDDDKMLEELKSIEAKANDASSTQVLHLQERRFATVAAAALQSFMKRCNKVLEDVEKQRDLMEVECRQYLEDRAKSLEKDASERKACVGEAGTTGGEQLTDSHTLLENDPLARRVSSILEQLQVVTEKVESHARVELQNRQKTLTTARNSYESVFNQNLSELHLMNQLQECFAGLKAQVHGLLLASKASEESINDIIERLELKTGKAPQQPDLTQVIQSLVSQDLSERDRDAATISSISEGEVNSEMAQRAEEALKVFLQSRQIKLHRFFRTNDASDVLGLLDQLRHMLYARGRFLNAIIYGVELVKLSPDYYIEPKPYVKEEESVQSQSSRSTKKSGKGKAAVSLLPLPAVVSAEAQIKEWTALIRTDVKDRCVQHFSKYPNPLVRRLPGMKTGDFEGIWGMTLGICSQQEGRISAHLREAVRAYSIQVRRVNLVLQICPQFLMSSLYCISSTALEERLMDVLNCFSSFFSLSVAARVQHKKMVKVMLGAKQNAEKLLDLRRVEVARQEATEDSISKFWGYVLRELQDESGLHAARNANTAQTYFHILRGLVTPEHLQPQEQQEVMTAVGRHKGLKQLLRLRAREDRLKEVEVAGTSPSKKERYLQETMPLHKVDTLPKSPINDKGNSSDTIDSGPLPLLPSQPTEFAGLPLSTFRPLEMFNEQNSSTCVPYPVSAGAFYPISDPAAVLPGKKGVAGVGKGKRREISLSLENMEHSHTSPAFVAPFTQMHQETVALALQSIELLSSCLAQGTQTVNNIFELLRDREAQWRDNWMLMMSHLSEQE